MTAPTTPSDPTPNQPPRDRLCRLRDVLCIIFPARRSTLVELSEGARFYYDRDMHANSANWQRTRASKFIFRNYL